MSGSFMSTSVTQVRSEDARKVATVGLPFTIQIPVFNETRALSFSSFYFDRVGMRPRYLLDTQRTPEAEAALRALGHEIRFFFNDKPFIENGYEQFAAASPTDWILRLDCDEVPSLELIEFCRGYIESGNTGVVGFDRHQVIWRDNRLMTATTERFLPAQARQWRLFNRHQVSFDRRIHTPGIYIDEHMSAPPQAAMYHLSWIFLDWNERLEKAARYNVGQATEINGSWLVPLSEIEWTILDVPLLRDAFCRWLRREERKRLGFLEALRRKASTYASRLMRPI
jgi:hypothetical protein